MGTGDEGGMGDRGAPKSQGAGMGKDDRSVGSRDASTTNVNNVMAKRESVQAKMALRGCYE